MHDDLHITGVETVHAEYGYTLTTYWVGTRHRWREFGVTFEGVERSATRRAAVERILSALETSDGQIQDHHRVPA